MSAHLRGSQLPPLAPAMRRCSETTVSDRLVDRCASVLQIDAALRAATPSRPGRCGSVLWPTACAIECTAIGPVCSRCRAEVQSETAAQHCTSTSSPVIIRAETPITALV
jgi:hypothetical protein